MTNTTTETAFDELRLKATGHVLIVDDTDENNPQILVDKCNAIHPQNFARIVARALSREDNSWIHRIAFGNGGTITDAAFTVTFKTPNDGQVPDTAGWASRLYNETYTEIVDDSNPNVTAGNGSTPDDPESIEHVSGPGVRSSENGVTSDIVIEAVLNANEPLGQQSTDNIGSTAYTEDAFTFDEIGLFTTGRPPAATAGYQNVDVSSKAYSDPSGLSLATQYAFSISVDGAAANVVTFTTTASGSGTGGVHTFADLANDINAIASGYNVEVTDPTQNIQTYGYVKFFSQTTGPSSAILLGTTAGGGTADLFTSLSGYAGLVTPSPGSTAGVQNDTANSENERERLLSHIIFTPVTKTGNRRFKVRYTITVQLARSISPTI